MLYGLTVKEKNGSFKFNYNKIPICLSRYLFILHKIGDTDPLIGQDINYHGDKRGSKEVVLISSTTSQAEDIPNLEILDFNITNVRSIF
jgi:hypothetical protein